MPERFQQAVHATEREIYLLRMQRQQTVQNFRDLIQGALRRVPFSRLRLTNAFTGRPPARQADSPEMSCQAAFATYSCNEAT
ncbi:hypothetical protein Q669_11245 [Labrenzia sp. C1B10]|nr:hypothetical protein Q669_11245 [Labrenzia sp. C1B10]ERS07636.1 hypothetical protein Q675_19880 [Labrenzia sp. C1B70]